jgi:hypothetical protein
LKIDSSRLEYTENRPFQILELPLTLSSKRFSPEQVIIKLGTNHVDLGAFCYVQRSDKPRKRERPRGVVLSSLYFPRIIQISYLIEILSSMFDDAALRPATVETLIGKFKIFIDWADNNGHHDCLAGGRKTSEVFRLWATYIEERYRRFEMSRKNAAGFQVEVHRILAEITGESELTRGVRLIGYVSRSNVTEPVDVKSFSEMLAVQQAMFDGICELVLGFEKFPFKLVMPVSLGWKDSHLWLFPCTRWCLPPHLWGEARNFINSPTWAVDYENGRVTSVDENLHRFPDRKIWEKRTLARGGIVIANEQIRSANQDDRYHLRLDLALAAQRAFLLLFLANTGANLSVARAIETDGIVRASTANQKYRAVKFRANGREVSVVVPVAFMPKLQRFMDLRRYLLGDQECDTLFITLHDGPDKSEAGPIHRSALAKQYELTRRIYPDFPRISAPKIRVTVADYYRRTHDGEVAAAVLGHSEGVADRHYLAGSPIDQKHELTLFFELVSKSAQKQKVVGSRKELEDSKVLEEGGKCSMFGDPQPLIEGAPSPNCRQGCLFCRQRVLVADEEDIRKVASAAFLLEHLVSGPMSEAEFRPLIQKCESDLKKIAAVGHCEVLVEKIKLDVYENGNLTKYFADKYQVFLELGVL